MWLWTAAVVLLCGVICPEVQGHGRLMEPPSRGSMWRVGFKTPKDHNDNELNCGGLTQQWRDPKGLCGVCGDRFDLPPPRPHERGGIPYGNGPRVRTYVAGQVIDVMTQITANHKGWSQFRLCSTNDPDKRATQECLDRHLLTAADTNSTEIMLERGATNIYMKLRLPAGLTCSWCVLQWRWRAGNSWGDVPGCKGMGCGNQEEFFGCADIKIIHETQPESPSPSTTTPTTTTTIPTTTLTTTTTPTTTTTTTPTPAPTTTTMTATATPSSQPPRQTAIPTKSPAVPTTVPAGREKCRFYPVGVWRLVQGMTFWCNAICSHVGPNVYCPWSHCAWACL